MPLTKKEAKAKKAMKKEYGAKKGADVFYGWEYNERHGKPHGKSKKGKK